MMSKRKRKKLIVRILLAYCGLTIYLSLISASTFTLAYLILSLVVAFVALVAIYRPFKYRRWRRLRRNGGSHTQAQWLQMQRDYGYRCVYCGSREKLTKDHIIPVSRGGTDHISNIQPLCRSCNSSKGNSYGN